MTFRMWENVSARGVARTSDHLVAEKRLSNEFADTTGWAPATRLLETVGAAAGAGGVSAAVSVTAGLSAGLAEACLVSVFAGFGLASAILGLAEVVGCVVVAAVTSADALPPRPTLRARLEKKPSDSPLCAAGVAEATDCVAGAAEATRVDVDGAVDSDAVSGSVGDVTCPRGGLTVSGMVPGAFSVAANSDGPEPPSERPVLPLGTLAANTRC